MATILYRLHVAYQKDTQVSWWWVLVRPLMRLPPGLSGRIELSWCVMCTAPGRNPTNSRQNWRICKNTIMFYMVLPSQKFPIIKPLAPNVSASPAFKWVIFFFGFLWRENRWGHMWPSLFETKSDGSIFWHLTRMQVTGPEAEKLAFVDRSPCPPHPWGRWFLGISDPILIFNLNSTSSWMSGMSQAVESPGYLVKEGDTTNCTTQLQESLDVRDYGSLVTLKNTLLTYQNFQGYLKKCHGWFAISCS